MSTDESFRDGRGRGVRFLELPAISPVGAEHCPPAHFAVFVAADARDIPGPALLAFAESLIRAGCVYAVCWGPDCASMEDAFDYADVFLHEGEVGDDTHVVMTTSHSDEPLEEALLFATRDACPVERYVHSCNHLLVLLVGAAASLAQARAFFSPGKSAG